MGASIFSCPKPPYVAGFDKSLLMHSSVLRSIYGSIGAINSVIKLGMYVSRPIAYLTAQISTAPNSELSNFNVS